MVSVEKAEQETMVALPAMPEDLVGRALVGAKSEAIIACDRAGIIQLWNHGAECVFGHSKDEALGQSLDVIIPERFRSRHWESFHAMMQTGKSRYADGALLAVP